jgi:hypothetical protein
MTPGCLGFEDLHRVGGQAVQEIDDVKVAGQRVRQTYEGPGQHSLAGHVAAPVALTGIPGPGVPPGGALIH